MAVADGRPEPDLEIRALEVDDVVFVRDSWRESYKTAPQRRTMSWPAYKATYGRAIDRLLEREDVLILGAYSADGRVKGWIAWTPGGVPTVHYVYVRDALRRLGVAGRLIRAAELGRRMVYSLRGKQIGRASCRERV